MIIPQPPSDPEPLNSIVETKGRVEASPSLEGLQILVVDDEADALELLNTILQNNGAEVIAVASVKQALTIIETATDRSPDVLVSDIGMPDEDGYSLIRKLRELEAPRGGKLPAIALTAYAASDDRRQALLAGFQMHLTKPVDAAELVAVVASLTGRTSRC
jgi:CheY-like chemotaxis protein